ncbi:Serpentine receptor class gamma-5 [Aphelenchoides avenae]|nr:Serpentine receptor class gamma-5 [Aphelenchus avenae]
MQNHSSSAVSDVVLNLQAIVPLVYTVPSFVLYGLVISVLIRRFKEPFYVLFAVNGFMECLTTFVLYFVERANHSPLFKSLYDALPAEGAVMNVWYFVWGYFRFAVFVSGFWLTFNRFSIVLFPTSYEKKWRRLLPVAVTVSIVLPVVIATDAILHGGKLVSDNLGYTIAPQSEAAEVRLTVLLVVISFATTIAGAVMEVTTGIFIFRRRKAMPASGKSTRGMELGLYLLSLKVFAGGLITLLVQIVFFLLHTQAEMTPMRTLVLINIQLFVLDVQVCSNPWILIAMSRSVRRELWSYIPLTPRPIKADADRAFSVRTVTNNGHSVRHTHSSVP